MQNFVWEILTKLAEFSRNFMKFGPNLTKFFWKYFKFLNKYRRGSEFIRLPCPYRTVPYRFPRGTVLVDRTAYRTFLTVFRDLNFIR
jgi:hypothetical protein